MKTWHQFKEFEGVLADQYREQELNDAVPAISWRALVGNVA